MHKLLYGFDGNGKRVRKTEGGASTYYVYSLVIGSAVMEVASAGVQRAYVMNGGGVVAQRNPDGNFYWLHADHLGSGRKMTNTSGNLTYRAEFDPYGKLTYEWSATPNQNTKKFTGYERDAGSGLDYAQARMYSSEWGRFMSPDPMSIRSASALSPKSFNRYTYVDGDPVNKVDPFGLFGLPAGFSIPNQVIITNGSVTITATAGPVPLNGYALTGIGAVMHQLLLAARTNAYWMQYVQLAVVPSSQPSQTQRPLTGDKKKEYDEAKKDALNLSKECKDNLTKLGIPADKVIEAINTQKAFDGITSNLTAGSAGLVPNDSEWANKSVADFLQNSVKGGAYAATSIYGGDKNVVYFNTKEITFGSTIFHEALHQVTGKAEKELGDILGASIGGLDSKLIQLGCNP